MGQFRLPRSAAASGDELRDLSAEGAGPISISLSRFRYGSFGSFIVADFDESLFLGRRSWN